MSQDSILKKKSFDFAVRIIGLYKHLKFKQGEYILSKQILKSGTAIGALIREAEFASSKADFLNKLSIGLKEANESVYWLDLLHATSYITKRMYESMISDARGLVRMLVS
ncbi:MAG TPA: four helix bundle protein, partial [Chitinophagaceae bacterium]